jgi:hypothetical protein
MKIEVRKIINKNTSLVFGNMKKINKFFIDDNDNLQYKSIGDGKMDDNILLSEVVIEVGHISNIKLKHIKNMIKYPDMVNIIKHNCILYNGIYVGGFLLTGIYLLNINKNYNWVYIVGEKLNKFQEDIDFNVGDYGISSYVAK